MTGITPKGVHIYTTPDWKRRVLSFAIEMARSKQLTVPSLTKRTMSDVDMKKLGKEAADFARRTAEELMKRSEAELDRMAIDMDEGGHLLEAVPFLMKELGCEVHISSADDNKIYESAEEGQDGPTEKTGPVHRSGRVLDRSWRSDRPRQWKCTWRPLVNVA